MWLCVSLPTIGLFVVAVLLFVFFVVVELRSRTPLVRFGIFRLRSLTGANLLSLFSAAAFGSMVFVLTLYMQNVLNYSAISTGLAFLPLALVMILASNFVARVVLRVGIRNLTVSGMVVFAIGLLLFVRISVDGNYVTLLLPSLLLIALGLGFAFPAMFIAGTAGVNNREQGLASGLLNTTQQVGAGVGLAVISAIATARTTALIQSHTAIGKAAVVAGFQAAFITCTAIALVGGIISFVVIRTSMRPSTPQSKQS
jgi:hypothetical protein